MKGVTRSERVDIQTVLFFPFLSSRFLFLCLGHHFVDLKHETDSQKGPSKGAVNGTALGTGMSMGWLDWTRFVLLFFSRPLDRWTF